MHAGTRSQVHKGVGPQRRELGAEPRVRLFVYAGLGGVHFLVVYRKRGEAVAVGVDATLEELIDGCAGIRRILSRRAIPTPLLFNGFGLGFHSRQKGVGLKRVCPARGIRVEQIKYVATRLPPLGHGLLHHAEAGLPRKRLKQGRLAGGDVPLDSDPDDRTPRSGRGELSLEVCELRAYR